MTTKIFPISGPLREPLLILEWMIVFISLELTVIFLLRIKSEKIQRLKILQEKAYGWLLFGYSIMWIFIIIGDYYMVDLYLRILFLNIGFFLLIVCSFFFIIVMEKYKTFLKKFLFTKIFFMFIIIYLFFIIIALIYATYVATIFWIVFYIFFLIYLKEIYSEFYVKRELGKIKKDFLKLCFGVLLIAVGYQFTTRLVAEIYGLFFRLIGDIFQLVGLILLFLYLTSIPSFSEYDWQEKIERILIMHKSGLLLYQKKFREQQNELDDSIISGVMTILKMMLEKIAEKEEKSIIEKQGKVIIIHPGQYIIGVIICDEKLNSLQVLLDKFLKKVETIYSHILATWDGNLNVFAPIENIAKEIFY